MCFLLTFSGFFQETEGTKKMGKMDGSGENHGADLKGNTGSLPNIKTALAACPLYSTALFKESPSPFAA